MEPLSRQELCKVIHLSLQRNITNNAAVVFNQTGPWHLLRRNEWIRNSDNNRHRDIHANRIKYLFRRNVGERGDMAGRWFDVFAPLSAYTVNGTLDLQTYPNLIYSLNGSGLATAGSGGILTVSNGGTFAGIVSGAGGRTVAGGTLILSGANTYFGATLVSAGTLQAGGSNVFAPLSAYTVNGTLALQTYPNTIDSLYGSGLVTTGSGGILTVSNGGTFAGIVSGSRRTDRRGRNNDSFRSKYLLRRKRRRSAGTLQGNTTSLQRNITNNAAVVFNQTGTGTYSGVMSGSGTLTTIGAGTITLTGSNTYSGATLVSAGTLQAGGANVFAPLSAYTVNGTLALQTYPNTIDSLYGSGLVTTGAGGILTVSNGGNFGGAITGSGAVTLAGGILNLYGTNSYTGGTLVSAGTLALSGNGSLSSTGAMDVASGATFDISAITSASTQVGDLTGPGTVNLGSNNLTAGRATPSVTFGGTLIGSGSFTKTGSGTLTLSGTNSYTGGTTLAQGVLSISQDNNLGGAAGNITASGGTLQTTSSFSSNRGISITGSNTAFIDPDAGATLTLNGVISGPAGSLAMTGAGMLVLTGTNTYSGTTIISNGTLSISTLSNLGHSSNLTFSGSGGTIQFANTFGSFIPVTLNANGTFDTQGNSVTDAQSINGGGRLTITGAGGLLILSGSNSYSGGTLVSAGTLQGDTDSLQGNITNNSIVIFDQTADGTYAGIMSGTGMLKSIGPAVLTLSGTNSYFGGTKVALGTLQGTTTSLQGDIINNAEVIFNQSGNGIYAGKMSGAGTLIKTGAGTVNLTGDNSGFSGTAQISQGTLAVNNIFDGSITIEGGTLAGVGPTGSVTVTSGSISPGNSIGTLTIDGTYTQSAGTTYDVEVNSLGQSDRIAVIGTATLNGYVDVLPLGGYAPNTPYTILSATGGLTGSFHVLNGPLYTLSYTSNDVILRILQSIFAQQVTTGNQKQVAQQWDSLTTYTPDQAAIQSALLQLTPVELGNAFDQMSGQQYTSLIYIAQESTQRFVRSIFYPLCQRVSQCCNDSCENRYKLWISGEGGKSKQQGDINSKGYRNHHWNVSLGAHKRIASMGNLGVAFFYEHNDVNFPLGGNGRFQTYLGALYGSFQNERCYFLSEFLGGWSRDIVKRRIAFSTIDFTAQSSPYVGQATFYKELGLNFFFGCVGLQPFVAFEYEYYHRQHVEEKDGDSINLNVLKKSVNTYNSFLGLHLAGKLAHQLTLGADISWERRFNFPQDKIRAAFQDFGQQFRIVGFKKSRDIGFVSVNLLEEFAKTASIFGEISGELAKHYSSYEFTGGLSMKW